jgi:uncharacterized membrane protein YraQ (UPF0718 family)
LLTASLFDLPVGFVAACVVCSWASNVAISCVKRFSRSLRSSKSSSGFSSSELSCSEFSSSSSSSSSSVQKSKIDERIEQM